MLLRCVSAEADALAVAHRAQITDDLSPFVFAGCCASCALLCKLRPDTQTGSRGRLLPSTMGKDKSKHKRDKSGKKSGKRSREESDSEDELQRKSRKLVSAG